MGILIKIKMKNWLINHPKFNPYNFTINSAYRNLTAKIRILPDFLIIGYLKTGTTSLYDYLIKHPQIIAATRKEIHFFDGYYYRGVDWYKANFCTLFYKKFLEIKIKSKIITGEATPNYVYFPDTENRIKKMLPDVKIIIILRNPIDRAYSDYNYRKKLGRGNLESISFHDAVKEEIAKFANPKKNFLDDLMDDYKGLDTRLPFVHLGIYLKTLKNWFEVFNKNQLFVIQTEELEECPQKVVDEVLNFLNLKPFRSSNFGKKNVGKYEEMNSETRKILFDFYKPYNEELENFLGKKFNWS